MSNTATATTWVGPTPPAKYRQVSACPKCGAPIYVDAELGDDVLDTLPTPWYTCLCRVQVSLTIWPNPITIPTLPNSVPTNPFPPSDTWITNTYPCASNT